MGNELFDNVWSKMKERLEKLQADHDAALFGNTYTTSAHPSVNQSLTMADIEKALHDIDPDGRRLQEARLMGVCAKLTKEQVEMLIWSAELMVNPPKFIPSPYKIPVEVDPTVPLGTISFRQGDQEVGRIENIRPADMEGK